MTTEDRAKESFQVFLYLCWKHLGLPKPTPAQYEIASYLESGPRYRGIMAFRGIGKSFITAAYVLWRLYKNCDEKVLVLSASSDRSVAFSVFLKRLIDDWSLLHGLRPEKGQRESVLSFDVGGASIAQAPSVRAAGIHSQITGGRATMVVLDDVEVPSNVESEVQREKLRERTKEVRAILVPDSDLEEGYETSVTILGTPQSSETLYGEYAARGYDIRVWPALYPTEDNLNGYREMGAELFPEVTRRMLEEGAMIGEPTDPQRFNAEDLASRKLEYGQVGFALQFQLDASLSDAERFPLRASDAIVTDLDSTLAPTNMIWSNDPKNVVEGLECAGFAGDRWYTSVPREGVTYAPYASTVMAVDPAGRGQDETSYAVVSQLNGFMFVREVGGYKEDGASDLVLSKLAHVAKKYPGCRFQVEANFGDGAWAKLWSPVLHQVCGTGLPLQTPESFEVKHSSQKEKRIIDSLGPALGRHRLVFDRGVISRDWKNIPQGDPKGPMYRFAYQLTHITLDKGSLAHDDRVDALAMAVAFHQNALSQDAEANIKAAKWAALEAEGKRTLAYLDHHVGPKAARSTLSRYFGD